MKQISHLGSLSSSQEGTVEDGVSMKGTVIVGKGSIVKSGTYIEGPCIIGRNCRIGPHAYIRGATSVGDDCHIGHCTPSQELHHHERDKDPAFQLYWGFSYWC